MMCSRAVGWVELSKMDSNFVRYHHQIKCTTNLDSELKIELTHNIQQFPEQNFHDFLFMRHKFEIYLRWNSDTYGITVER